MLVKKALADTGVLTGIPGKGMVMGQDMGTMKLASSPGGYT